MTVKELIEVLAHLPEDAQVMVNDMPIVDIAHLLNSNTVMLVNEDVS